MADTRAEIRELNDPLFASEADPGRYWSSGPEALDAVLGNLGVAIRPDDDIVEIGCGLGRVTRPIAERSRTVRALDVSTEMLHRAREENAHLDNVAWLHGDGTSLAGVRRGSADGVVSCEVLQHLPDPDLILGYVGEIGRVLRPGGWAAFQVCNNPARHRPRGEPRLGDRLRALTGRPARNRRDAWLGSAVSSAEVRRAASTSGMEIERTRGEGTRSCLVLARKHP